MSEEPKKKEAIEFSTNPFEIAKNLIKEYGGKAIDYAKGLGSNVSNAVTNLLVGDIVPESFGDIVPTPEQPVAVTEDMLKEKPGILPKPKKKIKKPEYISAEPPKIEAPELIVYNRFLPDIKPFDESSLMEGYTDDWDLSINVLLYLKELGYSSASWVLSPEYDEDNCHTMDDEDDTPICLWNSLHMFTIDDLISMAHMNAENDGYYPPKTIISNAHSRCRCHILCEKPYNVDQIPDSAPGLPSNATKDELKKFKEELYNRLTDVTVDRFTYLMVDLWESESPEDFDIAESQPMEEKIKRVDVESKEDSLIKIADEEWKEEIKPITLIQDFIYKYPIGIIRAIPKSYIGFQLETKGDQAKIYLSFAGTLTVPKSLIKEIILNPSLKERPEVNTFIMVGDDLALVLKYELYENTVCYLPAFDSIMEVDDFKVLDIME